MCCRRGAEIIYNDKSFANKSNQELGSALVVRLKTGDFFYVPSGDFIVTIGLEYLDFKLNSLVFNPPW